MLNLESLLTGGITVVSIVGILAFFVALVTQLTKDFIPKVIPTKLYVIIISLVVTLVGVVSLLQYKEIPIKFYYLVGSVVLGFIVAFISNYGWDEFKELKDRFIKK